MTGRLISVNVGLPKVVDLGARQVETAIWKLKIPEEGDLGSGDAISLRAHMTELVG